MRMYFILITYFLCFQIPNVFSSEKNELKFLEYVNEKDTNIEKIREIPPYNEDEDSKYSFEDIVIKKG